MKKKVLSILLTLALLLSIIPAIGITAGAEVLQDVVYVDATGAAQTPVNAAKVTSGDTAWTDGWYVAEGSVTVNNTVTVTGDVKLILTDGCNLTVNGNSGVSSADVIGIRVSGASNSLTVYAQSVGSGMGSLTANSGKDNENHHQAGLGVYHAQESGNITVNGGNITACGCDEHSASSAVVCRSFTLNGGIFNSVWPEGGAAGISVEEAFTVNGGKLTSGGIFPDDYCDVTVTGGDLTVCGIYYDGNPEGDIEISGGSLTIAGDAEHECYGIIGGTVSISEDDPAVPTIIGITDALYSGIGSMSSVEISGGTVNVTAKKYGILAYSTGAASVEISGGKVSAAGTGAGSFGIYSYSAGGGAEITVSGGEVEAAGVKAGIEGHSTAGAVISISDSTVTATASASDGFGIFSDCGKVEISDSTVTATGGFWGIQTGFITFENSTVKATGTDLSLSGGVCAAGTVTVDGSTVMAHGHDAGICSDMKVTVTDSTVVAGNVTGKAFLTNEITVDSALYIYAGEQSESVTAVCENRQSDDNIASTLTQKYVRIGYDVCALGSVSGTRYGSVQAAVNAAGASPAVIYLTRDAMEDVNIPAGKNITLDLNGYVLQGTGTGSVITVANETSAGAGNAGILTVKDSNTGDSTHNFKVGADGVWTLTEEENTKTYESLTARPSAGDVIKVAGGCITGGIAEDGGGIYNYGTLTLESGNVIGSKATEADYSDGGGIYNRGKFTMDGGVVAGNLAKGTDRGNGGGNGGGVYNDTFSTTDGIMNGGSISYNSADQGGGICNSGKLTVKSGRILRNYAKDLGGGILNDCDEFNMEGGIVSGNTSDGVGGGVMHFSGAAVIGGTAKICGNSASVGNNMSADTMDVGTGAGGNGIAVPAIGMNVGVTKLAYNGGTDEYYATSGKFTTNGSAGDERYFSSDADTYCVSYNNGGYLELTGNKVAATTNGTTVFYSSVLDALKHGESSASNVPAGEDAQNPTVIKLLGSVKENVIIPVGRNITLDLNDYMLIKNTNNSVIINYGTLTLTDNTPEQSRMTHYFKEHPSVPGWYGVQCVENEPGCISVSGGCVTGGYTQSGSGVINEGVFIMTDGNIVGNFAAANGGGVYSIGLFKMTGGSIVGNFAVFGGGGFENGGELVLGGTAVISGNTAFDTESNLIIYDADPVSLGTGANAPQSGMDVHVSHAGQSMRICGSETDYSEMFTSDKMQYYVAFDGDNDEILLKNRVTVQPSLGSGYTATVCTDDLTAPTVTYQWVKLTETVYGLTELSAVPGTTSASLTCNNKQGNPVQAGSTPAAVSDVIFNYKGTGLTDDDYVTYTMENVPDGTQFQYLKAPSDIDGSTYTVPLTYFMGEIYFNVSAYDAGGNPVDVDFSDFKVHHINQETLSGETGAALTSGETGAVYRCNMLINGKPVVTEPTEYTSASSGGGGTAPSVTVPVSGDKDTVKVKATVSGTNASVNDISDTEIEQIGTGSYVTVDLGGLNKSVSGVTLSKSTVEKIASSDADGLKIILPNGVTVILDKAALSSIASQAKGRNIKLVVERSTKAEQTLNSAQRNAMKELNEPAVLEVYIVSDGVRIGDFGGGRAEIIATYPTGNPVRVWYLTDSGARERIANTFDGELAAFTVTHFSHYVIEQTNGAGNLVSCPQDATCVYASFTDADTKAWYHDGVHFCVEKGYMNGVSASQFEPAGTLSRGMIVTMLWRMDGSPASEYAMSFTDVAANAWYTEAIRWAQSTGVVTGYDEKTFGPQNDVTREQLAAILCRYAQYKGTDIAAVTADLSGYADSASISAWAVTSVKWANAVGIINGRTATEIAPTGTATRAEAACMIQRFCETAAK